MIAATLESLLLMQNLLRHSLIFSSLVASETQEITFFYRFRCSVQWMLLAYLLCLQLPEMVKRQNFEHGILAPDNIRSVKHSAYQVLSKSHFFSLPEAFCGPKICQKRVGGRTPLGSSSRPPGRWGKKHPLTTPHPFGTSIRALSTLATCPFQGGFQKY